jgi:DNA-binding CsgD family transcriptional regulator
MPGRALPISVTGHRGAGAVNGPTWDNSWVAGTLLERGRELAELAAAAREAASGAGSVALVSGEAGIGKSSLVRAVRTVLPAEGRLLVGYCDDLATPRVLGPLRDLVGHVGPELTRALADGADRGRVLDALRAELDWAGHPTVLAIEDVHWADEATLDVLQYLTRRVRELPAVLVLTFRDDEPSAGEPLRRLLGQAARAERVRRLPLSRLSSDAVRRLSAASGLDADDVFAVTSGNPFFVTEVLAARQTGGVPPTIADAVLARVGGLDPATRDVVEQLAVVPSTLDRWLVEALVPGGMVGLVTAEQAGLLVVSPVRATFLHELTRRAIGDATPSARRVEWNRRVLAALVARPGSDLSRIVHHAAEAGDVEALTTYGPGAAREASEAGAHREAAAHYRLVLEHADRFPPQRRVGLLEAYAVEAYTLGDADAAVTAQRQAVALRRAAGGPEPLGAALRWLSRMRWWAGDVPGAEESSEEAVAVLDGGIASPALAMALSGRSQLYALSGRDKEAVALGERAAAMARAVGAPGIVSHALNNVGVALAHTDAPRGRELMRESLRVALDAGEVEHACRAYVNLIWDQIEDRRYAAAGQLLADGLALAEGTEYLGFLRYLSGEQIMLRFATGDWDEAMRAARLELDLDLQPPIRFVPLVTTARIAVRRGLPEAADRVAEASAVADGIGELQRTGPAAVTRAEAAWLRGDIGSEAVALAARYAEARRHGSPAVRAELALWHARAGGGPARGDADHPYGLLAAGRWREAAAAWAAAGNPYEQAAALADGPDPDDLLAALAILDRLRAEPLARMVRARLRDRGVSRIPRGPLGTTRGNPAGLTERQVEVAHLLSQGLSNGEIAQRLVVSVRTVDNHVAAVLDKLGARNRRDVAARAGELGVSLTG